MRLIGAVTVSRSDYGIYTPILREIKARSDLRLRLYVSGAHLSPQFGFTVKAIEADGFEIHETIEMLLDADTPQAMAKSMGLGTIGFAQAFAREPPDILLALGDRFEMHAAVVAAVPLRIPVAHIHGGELSQGAIDDAFRHSITKLSHLHFVSTADYARRVVQLGEEPWRVIVSGAPSLDNLKNLDLLSRAELEGQFDFDLSAPFLLVTYHPVTLETDQIEEQMQNLLAALETIGIGVVFTYPGADASSHFIIDALRQFVKKHRFAQLAVNLGTRAYFSMMKLAVAMVGNSSSGIIEAASFCLPAVNIGNRQDGRLRPDNVIDVGYAQEEIISGIQRAMVTDFRHSLLNVKNPYGDGNAARKIVDTLASIELDREFTIKRFHDA